jgi:hypothetical protein
LTTGGALVELDKSRSQVEWLAVRPVHGLVELGGVPEGGPDAAWHHDPATGIDPCEGLWICGPGDDLAVLHPDVVHDAITPVQRVVDRAAGEDETV